jgi:predicted GIY-YIG superfamily endonuclease
MERSPAAYMMASGFHGTLYTGVTSTSCSASTSTERGC